MATSGNTDSKTTMTKIIEDAYGHLGSLEEGEDLSSYKLRKGQEQLEKMIKSLPTKGVNLWAISRGTLSLVDGANSYTMGPSGTLSINKPLKILDAQWQDSSGNDTPVHRISRQEYFDLPNKTSEGKPTQIYYDPQLVNGTMYIWPTPDSSSDKLVFSYSHYIDDFDANSNDIDFPQEWHDYLSWGLALRLTGFESIGLNERAFVKQMADEMLEDLITFDQEDTPIQFGVEL